MIPDRDYYADKDGKLTTDPAEAAIQVAVKGFNLDERVAKRFGITDVLVSVDEPSAPRKVTGASVHIDKIEDEEEEKPEPQEPAVAVKVKKAAKEGEKKK